MSYYDRYKSLIVDGEPTFHPDIQLEPKSTDKFDIYEVGKTRFDKLSEKYYEEPFWGFLIMIANPELEGLEFLIANETAIRIPFPLEETLRELKDKVQQKKKYYGE